MFERDLKAAHSTPAMMRRLLTLFISKSTVGTFNVQFGEERLVSEF